MCVVSSFVVINFILFISMCFCCISLLGTLVSISNQYTYWYWEQHIWCAWSVICSILAKLVLFQNDIDMMKWWAHFKALALTADEISIMSINDSDKNKEIENVNGWIIAWDWIEKISWWIIELSSVGRILTNLWYTPVTVDQLEISDLSNISFRS